MITRLGQGGMGEVWRADDLVLQTPVALKLIHSATPQGRERILKEVRLARQITHPAICRVFDVGEADGQVFYTMELVDGEDLATLVRRVGRLPSEKVIDVGYQLSVGLAAAHARGVLHRDLKPGNVLVDGNGLVRITDFGIAITTGESGNNTVIGTPGYMAPEQLSPALPITERTDIYALGLILYELLVGQPALPRHSRTPAAPPPPPSTIVPDADLHLERLILKTLSPNPDNRPATVAEVASGLLMLSPEGASRRRWTWIAGGTLVVVVALLAVLAVFFSSRGARALDDQDVVVLADFTNTTSEPVFDGALKVALAVALEQSPFLKVFPDERVRETLQLMQRPPDQPVTRSFAREIARRERFKAFIAGSIGSLGSHYVLALEAINAESGDVMAREQAEVATKEQVLTALGLATSRLREKLGESLASIQKFDAPLPRATTASLDALHAYGLALDGGRVSLRVESIPHLERAIELDPDFAMAQAALSGIYANNGRFSEAPAFSRRAFELRDRVSERERFFISWRYYLDAEQAWDKALELARSWIGTYPREAFAFNSLGIAAAAFGDHAQAVRSLREAIRLDPQFIPPYGNLIGSLIARNELKEARAVVDQARMNGVDGVSLRRGAYLLAFLDSDSAAMTRELNLASTSRAASESPMWEARTAAFAGRFRAAHDLFRRSAQSARRDGLNEIAAGWLMEDAESHAIAGQCDETRREVSEGLETARDNFTLERASRALALCDAGAIAAGLSNELASRFSSATLTARIHRPLVAATLALQQGEPARALELLRPIEPYDAAPSTEFWPSYLRGQAYLQLKNGSAAAAQFQRIVSRRGEAPTSPLYPLAYLGLGRAAVLNRNTQEARAAYERLFSLWKDADSGLRELERGRAEYALLR